MRKVAYRDYANLIKSGGGMMKNRNVKIKLRLKILSRVKASIASMLSPVLYEFAYKNVAPTYGALQL
jgi:hypothetical protein